MLRGLLPVLFLVVGTCGARAGDALEDARRALPPANKVTIEREHGEALACSERRATVSARISRDAPQAIADRSWLACKDAWASAALTFGRIREARGETGITWDDTFDDFGRTVDLLRADWNRRAPEIIARARQAGPPL